MFSGLYVQAVQNANLLHFGIEALSVTKDTAGRHWHRMSQRRQGWNTWKNIFKIIIVDDKEVFCVTKNVYHTHRYWVHLHGSHVHLTPTIRHLMAAHALHSEDGKPACIAARTRTQFCEHSPGNVLVCKSQRRTLWMNHPYMLWVFHYLTRQPFAQNTIANKLKPQNQTECSQRKTIFNLS